MLKSQEYFPEFIYLAKENCVYELKLRNLYRFVLGAFFSPFVDFDKFSFDSFLPKNREEREKKINVTTKDTILD